MTIEELHDKLFEVLCVVDKICRENNIRYCLDGGTELGAIREHDFIPWDDDMDICVLAEDYDSFLKAMQNNLPEHIHIIEPQDSSPYFFDNVTRIYDDRWQLEGEYSGNQVYKNYQSPVGTDVFIYSGCPSSKKMQKLFNIKNKIFHGMLMAYRYNIDWEKYTNLERAQIAILRFLGRVYSGNTPDRILRARKKWIYQYDAAKTGYRISVNAPIIEHYMHAMKNEWFFPLTSATLRGKEFPIEKGYDEKLTTIYGNYLVPEKNGNKYIQHMK